MGGSVSVRLNLNATGYSAEMAKAQRTMQGFTSATAAMGHGTVSSMQAASASIRLLEGGMNGNIRAAERFIGTIPGVGKALQAAFPLVGGIALAGVFVKIGEEAARAIQKINQAPQVISNSFREMNLSAETAIDTLSLSTAKMEQQIALLSGKRPNMLAMELAEASIAADKLATSLDNDNRKIAELIKANGLSALAGFLGKAGTAEVGGSVNSFDQQMADLASRRQHAVRTGDTAGAADLQKQLDDKRNSALAYANSQIGQRQNQGAGGLNQDANLAVLTGFRNTLVDQQDQERAEGANTAASGQLKKLEDDKKMAELAKQAQAQLLKVYEEQEKQQNAFNKMSVNDEVQFWTNRIGAFSRGGEQYLAVQSKIYEEIAKRPDLFKENKKNQAEVGKSAVEGSDLLGRGADALQKINAAQLERATKSAEQYAEAVAHGNEEQQKAATAFAEATTQMAVQQGVMSRLDAAQVIAQIHAQDHAKSIERVNAALADQIRLINSDDKLEDEDKANAIRNATQAAGNKTAAINAGYGAQQSQDSAAIASQQLGPAAQRALGEMVNDWSNMTTSMVQTMTKGIDSLNEDIVKAMMGHVSKADFGKTLSAAGAGLAGAGLRGAEGKILGAFGVGKADGSKLNPLWMRSADGVPGVPGSVGGAVGAAGGASGIWNSLKGLFSSGKDSFGMPTGFQGGFARGGDFLANRPMMVGELGPELLMPGMSGHVVPHQKLGGIGDSHNHFHIDARGSNDPAAIHAAVMRAAPHIVAASIQSNHQSAKRMPSGR